MKLQFWKQLNKASWFILATISLVVVAWLVVIMPAIGRLQRTVETISTTQASQAGSTQATANLIAVLQRQTELAEAIASLRQVFIDQAYPVVFINRLEELAAQHNVTLDLNVEVLAVAANQGAVVPTKVDIQVAGQWQDVLAFTNAIQTEPIALTVEQFTIATPSNSSNVVSLTLHTISYWRSLWKNTCLNWLFRCVRWWFYQAVLSWPGICIPLRTYHCLVTRLPPLQLVTMLYPRVN